MERQRMKQQQRQQQQQSHTLAQIDQNVNLTVLSRKTCSVYTKSSSKLAQFNDYPKIARIPRSNFNRFIVTIGSQLTSTIVLLFGSIAGLLLLCSQVQATSANIYYVGANLSYNIPKYRADGSNSDILKTMDSAGGKVVIDKNRVGFGVALGAYFEKNIGAELGYDHIARARGTNSVNQEVTARLNNLYVDIIGNKEAHNKVDLVGAIGLGRMKPKIRVANDSFATDDDFNKARYGVRVGIGALYKIHDHVNAKAMVRYQHGKSSFLKRVFTGSIGLNYLWM